MNNSVNWKEIEQTVQDLIDYQKSILLKNAKQIVPNVIADDLMQPNDFPLLENNALFRYEEGCLAGMQSIEMALKALKKQTTSN